MATRSIQALCARIPAGLGLMVEIGCGDGALGAWLARRDPAARRIATEADPDAAARAAPHYEAVHTLAPEKGAPLPPGCADLVVLHGPMRDPARALAAAAPLLAPEGVLLAEVPNAAHWRLAESLLRPGVERIAPPGEALTLDGLAAAVRAAGLVALDLVSPRPDAAEAAAFAARIAPALQALGTDEAAFLRRAGAASWILRAGRTASQPLHILAHTLKPGPGASDVRIHLPLGVASTWPGVVVRIGESPAPPDLPPEVPRIALLQRRLLNHAQAGDYINHFRDRGWVVVHDFDDDPHFWPVIPESGFFAFRGVHAVQTSTTALETLFRRFNDEVKVFPNTAMELPEPANFRDPSQMTLFLGALRREADLAPFLPTLNEVLAEAGPRLAVEVIYDRAAFDALATPHKRFHPPLSYGPYLELMARCELAFMPLADTAFNNCKSDLKFVEAGARGLCCLASPVVYAATIRDGENGIIVREPAELGAALRAMLADPARARAIGGAARAWVAANRMAAPQARERLAWYRSLWARRAALDAALLRRAPEVARAG